MGIDRQGEDGTGPGAADSLRSAPPDLPDIPNGPVAPPAAHDSAGSQERAERFSEYKAKVEAEYRREAVDCGCDRVREVEETVVTPAMLRIQAEDPDRTLAGFGNRLKGKDRLAEKEKYTAGVYADCARLEAVGFKPYDRISSWENDQYKGINSRWQEPNSGFLFEVQFHTQTSFEAKELTHTAYEKLRSTRAPPKDEQARLAEFQRQVTARVPIPPGATEIPDYSYK